MGFLEDAQDMLDRGVSAAKGAVSGTVVEQQAFMKGFVRLCAAGVEAGWHERTGGNLSYRLRPEEVSACRSYFYTQPSSWVAAGVEVPDLAGQYLAVTGADCPLSAVPLDPDRCVGIVEIDAAGAAWRLVWGLKGGGLPTSELPSHLECHSARMAATDGACRVVYHTHPTEVVALSSLIPWESRELTRVLWKAMTEAMMVFPEGVGAAPFAVPGSTELASLTRELVADFPAVAWAHHGLLVTGADFDDALGLAQVVVKAAAIYETARAANGGSDQFLNAVTDDQLTALVKGLNLSARKDFLGFPGAKR